MARFGQARIRDFVPLFVERTAAAKLALLIES
ncbi:three-helix bundle dimerization domain-containing protein [Rhodococcus opacus]